MFYIIATLGTQATMQQISKPRPPNENIQPKQPTSRPLNILPSNGPNIRPASSVSTQTIMGAQQPVYKHTHISYLHIYLLSYYLRLRWEGNLALKYGRKPLLYVPPLHLKLMLLIKHKSNPSRICNLIMSLQTSE